MITVGMSTSCVFPMSTDEAFRLARLTGFDGVEVMVTADRGTRRLDLLRASSARWGLPVLSVHAPVLPIAHFTFGRDQHDKLLRSAELAAGLGAATVVVHPPFLWQRAFSARFLDSVREIADSTGVALAVENMFPLRLGPSDSTCTDRVTTPPASTSTRPRWTSRTPPSPVATRSISLWRSVRACGTSI
nr:hypothetical protein GCM10025699_47060 [Microbacterium flavescens]